MPYWKNEEKCFNDTITNMYAITVRKRRKKEDSNQEKLVATY